MSKMSDFLSERENSSIELHNRKKLIRRAAVLLLIIIALLVLRSRSRNRVYKEAEVQWEKEQTTASSARYTRFGDAILRYSRDGMSLIGLDGSQLWNESYSMENPRLVVNGGYGAMADLQSNTAVILDQKGILGSIRTAEPIQNLAVSQKGLLALVLNTGSSSSIVFYSKSGTALDISVNLAMSISGYPLAMALSPDGTGLVVSAASSASGSLRSQIVFYNFAVGKGETNRMVGYFEYEGVLFPQINYLSEDRVAAVGDNQLVFFSLDNETKPALLKEIRFTGQMQSVTVGKGMLAAVMPAAGGTDCLLSVYDGNGKQVMQGELNALCRRIAVEDDYILMMTDSGLCLWDRRGKLRYNGPLAADGQAVFSTGTRELLQFDGQKLIRYKLK